MALRFVDQTNQAKLKGIRQWIGYKPKVYAFSLPAGYSCPAALECLSKANRITGKVTDGKFAQYRCYAASDEAYSPQARALRWDNFEQLRRLDTNQMANLLIEALPANADIVRVHVSGDFFNESYFMAWLEVARQKPDVTFYAYTKSIDYWVNHIDSIPSNLKLNASYGGRHDKLIDEHNLKSVRVIYDPIQATVLSLEIDHDEQHAIEGKDSFALLLHGTQPKGSDAGKALKSLRERKIEHSYSR